MPFFETIREQNENIQFAEGDCSFPAHFHKNVEFLYAEEDGINVMLNNTMTELNKNDFLIIESYAVHHIIGKGKVIAVCVPVAFLNDFFARTKGKRFVSPKYKDSDGEIYERLLEFNGINEKNFLLKKSAADGLLGLLLEKIPQTKSENMYGGVVEKTLIYLNENFKEKLDLEKIATEIGYNKFTLSHKFKSSVGMDIREYLNQIRINDVIGETEKNIDSDKKQIDYVMDAGFESVQTFYRAFKRCKGVTPKVYFADYRKNKSKQK